MKTTEKLAISVLVLGVMICQANVIEAATPMGTAFTYQERLIDADQPLDGFYDLQFKLFDDPDVILGVQVGSTIDIGELVIVDGHIAVVLDFGSGVFNGDARWLEIGVRPGVMDDPEVYRALMPRMELKPVPYTLHTRGICLDDDSGNVFVGQYAGYSNTEGYYNTFVGDDAGIQNTTGHGNTFLGRSAGSSNTGGDYNTFLGSCGGLSNTTGSFNTFIGTGAGGSNTDGSYNTFVGDDAGFHNNEGNANAFVGRWAGLSNTEGMGNTFIGVNAGEDNTTGEFNSFLGQFAGRGNTTGCKNTFLGRWAGGFNKTGSGNVFIGYEAGSNETGSNKLYIANGPSDPNVLIYGDFSTGRVGIGTTIPAYELDVEGDVQARAYHTGDIFFQKDGEKLWRMFEDQDGLYLENLNTRKVYSFVLQETENRPDAEGIVSLDQAIKDLKAENAVLKQRLAALEKIVQEQIVATARQAQK